VSSFYWVVIHLTKNEPSKNERAGRERPFVTKLNAKLNWITIAIR